LQLLSKADQVNDSATRLARFVAGAAFAEDATLPTLAAAQRALLGRQWRARASNELRTSRVFQQLHAELSLLPAAPQVLELCSAASSDESFHGQLCLHMAEHYGVCAAPLPPSPEPSPPSFPVCSPRVHRALFAVLQCSVNETLAVTYLSACLAEARSRVVGAVLKQILRDEVRHSRIGWAVLASPELSAADRGSISRLMPALLEACVAAWLADEEHAPDDPLPGYGFLTHRGIAAAARAALDGIILPGLEHLRVDAAPASRWRSQCVALGGRSRA
jgi:hypothetical protein